MEEVKSRISSYWSQRAEQFSALRVREMESGKHALWQTEFEKYIPPDRPLDILDVGTGTGFFAILLCEEGHRVTGIDLCPDMIEQARKTASRLGVRANFCVMDAECPALQPASFDAIVTRNLTWTLPHLDNAYRVWHTLLKSGGILVNFDADYCREDTSQPLPANHAHKNIRPDLTQEYERIKDVLRPGQKPRPEWDMELLTEAGFRDIRIDRSVWKRIYSDFDEFYNPTPIFTIAAKA